MWEENPIPTGTGSVEKEISMKSYIFGLLFLMAQSSGDATSEMLRVK